MSLILIALMYFWASQSQASPWFQQGDCRDINHPVLHGRVCIHLVNRRQNPDILYFFHGVDRKAEDWQDRPEFNALRSLWEKTGRGMPTVLSVSFGPRWFMKAADGNDPGVHNTFVREIMPALENLIGGLGPGKRMVLGESMGGANAALLFIREPQLFDRAAFLCPAFSTVSPFSVFDIGKYILRNKADGVLTWYFMGVARDLIGRPEAWSPNNPLDMITHMVGPQTPPVYVTSGENDEFGFFEGGLTYANISHDRQAPIQWVPRQGKHCANHDLGSLVGFFNATKRARGR
jgi:pimeloyl-ACP methyl ester carboxylesterase